MKLRSSFHDYYDAALSQGQDDTLLYLRYPIEENIGRFPAVCMGNSTYWKSHLSSINHLIGFCGKTYSVLEVNLAASNGLLKEDRNKRRFCYSEEDVDSFIKANFKAKEYEAYLESDNGHNKIWGFYETKKSFKNGFEKYAHKGVEVSSLQKYFKDHPIFVATEGKTYKDPCKLVYNACLKPYEFYRILDTYTAFQELSMWLGNKAVPMKPIPVMSDEIKIGAHGYDKWSFRKEPKK